MVTSMCVSLYICVSDCLYLCPQMVRSKVRLNSPNNNPLGLTFGSGLGGIIVFGAGMSPPKIGQ